MKKIKVTIAIILSVICFVAAWIALTMLLVPKYDGTDYPLEGNFTAEYYEETAPHDVLMVGDCEVYENFDPIYLWKNFGITSYIRGNAQQLVWHSYYMLEDALKYEKPKVVIYNVQSLSHGEPQREEYNRMALDGMKWSKTKSDAVEVSMCNGEQYIDYVFPLLRYHTRIKEISHTDVEYYASRRHVTNNGYYMRVDVLPASQAEFGDTQWIEASYPGQTIGQSSSDDASDESTDESEDGLPEDDSEELTDGIDDDLSDDDEIIDPWADIEVVDEDGQSNNAPQLAQTVDNGEPFSGLAFEYLDKIRALCADNDIQLILIKAPSLSPQWYDSQETQVVEYAEKYDLPYINFYKLFDETGIDYETDTYDGGLHMNYSGAQKLSEWLGQKLSEDYGLEDHRSDTELSKVYDEKVAAQEAMIEAQKKEIEEYGEVKTY